MCEVLSSNSKENKPVEEFILQFMQSDIEMAVESWLNNVVLRNPVTVSYINYKQKGIVTIVVVPVLQELPTDNNALSAEK